MNKPARPLSSPLATEADRLALAEERLGHVFASRDLLAEALRHSSAATPERPSNERMEFLGDAVIELAVCEELFRRHPDRDEGELSPMKSAVVSRRACAAAGEKLGLVELLEIGPGMRPGGRISATLGGNAFEAVAAALHLDAGAAVSRAFALRHLGPAIDQAGVSAHHRNFKSALQDFAQAWLGDRALYEHVGRSGPEHRPQFEALATIAGRTFPAVRAATKKQAEQAAAEQALKTLRAEPGELPAEARAQLDALLGGAADRGGNV